MWCKTLKKLLCILFIFAGCTSSNKAVIDSSKVVITDDVLINNAAKIACERSDKCMKSFYGHIEENPLQCADRLYNFFTDQDTIIRKQFLISVDVCDRQTANSHPCSFNFCYECKMMMRCDNWVE